MPQGMGGQSPSGDEIERRLRELQAEIEGRTRAREPSTAPRNTAEEKLQTDQGRMVLDIDVDYRFVYPVEPPHDPAAWMRIVAQISGHVEFIDLHGPGTTDLQPFDEVGGFFAGARCDVHDGFIHPQYPTGPPDKVRPTGTPVNPYSTLVPSGTSTCEPTTGT